MKIVSERKFWGFALVLLAGVAIFYLGRSSRGGGASHKRDKELRVGGGRSTEDGLLRPGHLPSSGRKETSGPNQFEMFVQNRDTLYWDSETHDKKRELIEGLCLVGQGEFAISLILENTNPGKAREVFLQVFGSNVSISNIDPLRVKAIYNDLAFESEKSAFFDGLRRGIEMFSYEVDMTGLRDLKGLPRFGELVEAYVGCGYLRQPDIDLSDPSAKDSANLGALRATLDSGLLEPKSVSKILTEIGENSSDPIYLLDEVINRFSKEMVGDQVLQTIVTKAASSGGVLVATELMKGERRPLLGESFPILAELDPTSLNDWFQKNRNRLSGEERDRLAVEMATVALQSDEGLVARDWIFTIEDKEIRSELENDLMETISKKE